MNGYIKVSILGQEIGLKFGYYAIKLFTEASLKANDVFFSTDENEQPVITDYGMAKLCHCAYKNNCVLKEAEPVLSFENFVNWIESMRGSDYQILADVMTVYSESTVGKAITEANDKEKKSQNQSTLMPSSESATEN